MNNQGKDREELIVKLLGGYLRPGFSAGTFTAEDHLDADTLAAFVDGNLSEKEFKPMGAHLAACSFCRKKSAELARLDLEFAEREPQAAKGSEPSKVSDVLSGILGKIFGASEGAVFAHQEEEPGDEGSEKEEGSDE